jgi:hypothetical protein
MGKVNIGRVVVGGIVAGIVYDILAYLVDGVLLAPRWAADMEKLGHLNFTTNQIVAFNLIGIIGGILTIWVYAAIRPRYGAGVKTAICAGVAVWFLSAFIPNLATMWVTGLFSHHLTIYTTAGALIEIVVGAIAGAALYTEKEA